MCRGRPLGPASATVTQSAISGDEVTSSTHKVVHERPTLRHPEEARAFEHDGVDGRRIIARRVHAPARGRRADVPEGHNAVPRGACGDVRRGPAAARHGVDGFV